MTESEKQQIVLWRRKIIENEFRTLNDRQQMAALALKGPLLILAGAGSGKTTVLVHRIAHILRWGEAYESLEVYGEYTPEEMELLKNAAEQATELPDEMADRLAVAKVYPWRILAITFTNKAARELKERIARKVGEAGNDIWASTFHACCTRILRRFGERMGYTPHFAIYDTDDQKKLIKDCMKALSIDEKMLPVKSVMAEISSAKDSVRGPEDYRKTADSDQRLMSIAKIYTLYQKRLLAADAMDFDDIIFNTVALLRAHPDILQKYQEQFRYVMVDEYQDTNRLQYELVHLLAGGYENLCVVGDDDQSIYKFRGATIRNILDFEDDYDDVRVIKLEQNYRSTKNILAAANSVIGNNFERKAKALWTENEEGARVTVYAAADEKDESSYIASVIQEQTEQGAHYGDFAVLYRTNSQSQSIERALVRAGVPYRIIGGRRFYERREIRDMMAYLSVIANHSDDIRLERILNVPKRGIGEKTVSVIGEISRTLGQSMLETMRQSEQFEALVKSSRKLLDFCSMIDRMTEMLDMMPASEMYEQLLKELDYENYLLRSNDYTDTAVDNIRELASGIAQYEEENGEEASLQGFLEETALMTDVDSYDNAEDYTVLMTLHSAKGLEFENVFIPGMEENLFPGYQATLSEHDMQEERRLAYVGITRAKKTLTLIHAASRMVFGRTSRNRPSRFLREIPESLIREKRRVITPVDVPEMSLPTQREARRADIAVSRSINRAAAAKETQQYSVGMRVQHKVFGEGIILNITPMASDHLMEIAFDSVGTKKLMAKFTKLTILS